jgi:xanthosine utilization system XapX-like protein
MAGIALLLGAGALAVITATMLRARLPKPATMALLALLGACLGAGALLVQDEPVNALNWAATLLLGSLFLPVHVWVAFGPPRAGART